MKTAVEKQITVTIVLDGEETLWLRDLLQRPFEGNEMESSIECRRNLISDLSWALNKDKIGQ